MISVETNDIILLTGAGFTKNFGGYLAHEMWAQIFNDFRIQGHQELRSVLQDNFDFESVYSQVVDNNKFTDEDKLLMKEVIEDAYRDLDNAIRGWKFNSDSPYPVNIYGLGNLFNKIWPGPYNKPSMFFTLNQDLFVENIFVPALYPHRMAPESYRTGAYGFLQIPLKPLYPFVK